MSDPEYPKNTIWYVEVDHSGEMNKLCGSAVAIRLQKINDPHSAKTYLITCSHVLRGKDESGKKGFGTVSSKIQAWAPGNGYSKRQAKAVSISNIKPIDYAEVSPEDQDNAADDWVVLEFEDNSYGISVDYVKQWAKEYAKKNVYLIIGFPGGSASFSHRDVVKPSCSIDHQYHEECNGILTLTGDETRLGNSGGGVFQSQSKSFIGIHRARSTPTRQVYAISAKKIRNRLRELNYEPSNSDDSSISQSEASILFSPSKNDEIDPTLWLEIASNAALSMSKAPSSNRSVFLTKVERLLATGDICVTVTDLSKYRKARASNMLESIAEELPKKYTSLEKSSRIFSSLVPEDPVIKDSRKILNEIESIVRQAKELFEVFGGYQNSEKRYRKCFIKAINAIEQFEDIVDELHNQGSLGYNSKNTIKSLSRLHHCINLCSDLLKGVEA
ncbi:MAG: trypsin-like peptidase domain-containing protein [Cyanobacteria bacterium J06649_4]